MIKRKIISYYEEEGKRLKSSDIDRFYRGYFRYTSTHACRRRIIENWLKSARPGETFLDIGCELGYFVRKMADKGLNAVGIDISPTKIRNATIIAKKVNLNCRFSAMDAENLEFKDNSFDWVLCTETLEHIPNDQQAILESIRVARRYILITVPLKSVFWRFIDRFSDVYGFEAHGAGHLRDYNTESVLKLLPKNIKIGSQKKSGYFISFFDRFLPDISLFKVILCLLLKKGK